MSGILRPKAGDRRGGRRIGAGRKKAEAPLLIVRPGVPDDIGEEARRHAFLVIASLAEIVENGRSELARVAAARLLLDWGYGPAGGGGRSVERASETPAERSKWDKLIH